MLPLSHQSDQPIPVTVPVPSSALSSLSISASGQVLPDPVGIVPLAITAPLSPLLSNLVLDDLDKELNSTGK